MELCAAASGRVRASGEQRYPAGALVGAGEPAAEEAMQLHLATERRFAELFAGAAPRHDEQTLLAFAHSIGGAAHQLAQWWLRTPGVSREQIVGWYCRLCWEGLGLALQRP
jgi:hypothetical protein